MAGLSNKRQKLIVELAAHLTDEEGLVLRRLFVRGTLARPLGRRPRYKMLIASDRLEEVAGELTKAGILDSWDPLPPQGVRRGCNRFRPTELGWHVIKAHVALMRTLRALGRPQ
jgi:hypothetical protein